MPRRKLAQEVHYKSFRYTSKNDLYLHEFLESLDNTNRFIVSIIKGSKRYKNYVTAINDEYTLLVSGSFDG